MEIAIRANQTEIEDQVSNVLQYRGWADPGVLTSEAEWQIRKFSINSGISKWEWADGNDNADNIWDNRASLSYS